MSRKGHAVSTDVEKLTLQLNFVLLFGQNTSLNLSWAWVCGHWCVKQPHRVKLALLQKSRVNVALPWLIWPVEQKNLLREEKLPRIWRFFSDWLFYEWAFRNHQCIKILLFPKVNSITEYTWEYLVFFGVLSSLLLSSYYRVGRRKSRGWVNMMINNLSWVFIYRNQILTIIQHQFKAHLKPCTLKNIINSYIT